MTFNLDPSVFSIAAICISSVVAMVGTLLKSFSWLSRQFTDLKEFLLGELDKHEEKDQKRHEDNIQRFATLETIVKNGAH